MNALVLVLQLVFWACVLGLAHTYAIYPLAMRLLARGRRLRGPGHENPDAGGPEVAVFLAAYNEEAVIEETLRSILANDYPPEKVEIVIGSDGSTDRTHEIVEALQEEFPDRVLRLEVFGGRNGKIRILNRLVADWKERTPDWTPRVLLLCDANVVWSPGTIRHLAKHFRRDEVGLVATNVLDRRDRHEGIGAAGETYVNGENVTKFAEGVLWGRVMGAFGACYAMRASLYQPVPENYIVDDFFLTMTVLAHGREAIMEPEAVCYEPVSQDIAEEFRRKRRIATGNFQNLAHFRALFRPWRGGWATWFAFWSHKGLRWYGPLLLGGLVLSTAALAFLAPFYLIPASGMALGFAGAAADGWAHRRGMRFSFRPFRFGRYFLLMNLALFLGWLRFLRGGADSVWEPTQRPVDPPRQPAAGAGS